MPNQSIPQYLVVGYDPGFGNTSVCIKGRASSLQTAVSRPHAIGLAAIGMKTAGSDALIVKLADHTFCVGAGSWLRGEPQTSMDFFSLITPPRLALQCAALAQSGLIPEASKKPPVELGVVIGLPVPLLQDTAQAELVIDSLRALKGEHHFEVNDKRYEVNIKKIKVVAQPVGAYMDWAFDDDFNARPHLHRAEVAVMDIGMNTLDLYVVQGNQVLERHIGGAEVGVRRLLELVATDGRDLVEVDADLRSGRLKPTSTQLDAWLSEILAATKRSWSSLKRFTAVIPTGGGALVLGERLRQTLAAKGAAIHFPADPIAANVRGFWKYGEKYLSA